MKKKLSRIHNFLSNEKSYVNKNPNNHRFLDLSHMYGNLLYDNFP